MSLIKYQIKNFQEVNVKITKQKNKFKVIQN